VSGVLFFLKRWRKKIEILSFGGFVSSFKNFGCALIVWFLNVLANCVGY